MDVEYLPFFEDEFFLKANDPERWERLITALRDLREQDDNDANIRGTAALISLISLQADEQDETIPIIARRFARDLESIESDRGRSALLALESAVERYHFKEDCPNLEECAKKDEFRKEFIASGNWVDTNVAYEHLLQKETEKKQAQKRSALRSKERRKLIEDLLTVPIMFMLPLGLFLALISTYLIGSQFSSSFMLVSAVLFSVEAFAIYLSWHFIVLNGEWTTMPSTRVYAIVSALILCVVSVIIAYRRSGNMNSVVSSAFCAPLALAQLFVLLLDYLLYRDYRVLRTLDEQRDAQVYDKATVH